MGQTKAIGHRIDDALIRLVQQQPIYLLDRPFRPMQGLLDRLGNPLNGKTIDFLTVHGDRLEIALTHHGSVFERLFDRFPRQVQNMVHGAIAA